MTIQSCDRCGESWCDCCDPDEGNTVDGDLWCTACTENRAWFCSDCEERHSDETECFYCSHCNSVSCRDTGGFAGRNYYCESCRDGADQDDGAEPSRTAIADYHGTNICYPDTKNAVGIELELNFDRDQRPAVLAAFDARIRGIEYHWERDGSIGEGAELITHPASYRAIRESGLRDALQDAWKAGARGYKSGKCGLHVHISRDQLPDDVDLLKRFMLLNQFKIESFAARKSNTYCSYPADIDSDDWLRSKYCCVNFQHENSVEFRVFRGTTNYERIRASIEFCAALCEYLKSLSPVAVKQSPVALHYWSFTRWVEESGRYRYLKERLVVAGWNDQSEVVETEIAADQ